ncbi:hypothetical protein P5673_016270 [Acropora cervicornis]|uniref:Uncharacterized protein n=1 Tax=Acropora cervicornis TaxID=6130 RepID=A0AAD9QHA0_ACRCE|nr:hypothetical protein P5673_016270 [Acropora cervicornis]
MQKHRRFFLFTTLLGICVFSYHVFLYFGPSLKTRPAFVKRLSSGAIHSRFDDFRRDWFRQHRARVDWKSILKPCINNTQWGLVKKYWGRENRSSARTSQVVYTDIRPAGEFSKIFIQSKTADNRTKLIGGDSWRVHLHGPSSLGATVFDHENGTYEILFLIMEPGNYQVIIYLDFSLCDGLKEPPADWFIKGNSQGKEQEEGILGPLDQYLLQPFNEGKHFNIRIPVATVNTRFIDKLQYNAKSCTQSCNHLWDGFGRWTNKTWRPYLDEYYGWSLAEGYRRKGTLCVYGDSLGVSLGRSMQSRALCKTLYERCITSYNWIYPISKGRRKENDDLDFRPELVIENIHKGLIRNLIHSLKKGEENKMNHRAKIIWKTTTSIHREYFEKKNVTSRRFITAKRIALFSAFATSAMCNAGFDVIDVYPISDAYPNGALDHVHYNPRVFWDLETLLEKYKTQNNEKLDDNKWKRLKRCIG